MRIGILTIHYGVNYGSVLQAVALYTKLKEMRQNVEIIDFVPEKYKLWNEFYNAHKRNISFPLLLCGFIVKAPDKMRVRRIFREFVKKYTKLSKPIYSKMDFYKLAKNYDSVIVGSDQVWNPDYNQDVNDVYMLSNLDNTVKRFSYAASIGKEELPASEISIFEMELPRYKEISVREDTGKHIIESIGFHADQVLDPTLLFSKEDWIEILDLDETPYQDRYLLIYVMDFLFDDLIDYAIKIAKERNLKIYMVSFKDFKSPKVDRAFTNVDPKRFLSLLMNADFVVSNSFHGIAFSINFNKEFLAIGKDKYNSRIQSLLRSVGLESNFIIPKSPIIDFNSKARIDYVAVNSRLSLMRDESNSFLNKVINNE